MKRLTHSLSVALHFGQENLKLAKIGRASLLLKYTKGALYVTRVV